LQAKIAGKPAGLNRLLDSPEPCPEGIQEGLLFFHARNDCGLNLNQEKEMTHMITVIVQFRLPKPVSRIKAEELFLSSAPRYRQVPGLVRKYYLLSEDGTASGGVYLFRTRHDAERLYTDEWKKYIVEKYGGEPSITYFESPVIVDNTIGEIIKAA
jgi:hypothetical protein